MLPHQPVSQLQNQTYNHLKELILTGQLDPNELYSETRMSNTLGVSRTPMREALHYLSQEGYITILPSRGFHIRQLNQQDMKETIEMRCAIEGYCIYKLTSHLDEPGSKTVLKDLQKCLDAQKKAMTIKNENNMIDKFMKADSDFHRIIVEYSDNEQFKLSYQRLTYLIHLTTKNSLLIPGRMNATYNEHNEIYNEMAIGNANNACLMLVNHLLAPLSLHLTDKESDE